MSRLIAVGDCETDPFKWMRVPRPFLWGFYDGLRYCSFRRTEDFIEHIKGQKIILYAHNGGKFDWHFVLPYINPYQDLMIINGRIARAHIGLCEVRDSYNILPVPLAAYKKDEIDYSIFEESVRDKPENWKRITDYLRSDCVYLHELITGFVQRFGLQITQASAAMNQWKKLSTSKVPQTTKEFYDTLSPFYYGGRVECFESGIVNTKFSGYDINSAYPEAMQHSHPYSAEFVRENRYVPGADFYKVRCVSKGAFPYRGEGDPSEFAGLRFPRDNQLREYFVTGWEYAAALETKTVHSVMVLESIAFLDHITFGDYIDHFYQMRVEAKAHKDDAGSLFAKLLMNSLYGKFAANPQNYRNYMCVPLDLIGGLHEMGWDFAGELGPWGLAEAPLDDSQQRYYNVATGASITGFVRAKLLRGLMSSSAPLYCDTDFIAVRQKGAFVELGEKLGQWKFEGTFDRAGIAGKKLYVFRGAPDGRGMRECDYCNEHFDRHYKHASKGARLSHKELWEVAQGKTVVWNNIVPTFSASQRSYVVNAKTGLKEPPFISRRIRYTAERDRTK